MKHRLLTTLALAVLACAVLASTAVAARGGAARLYQFRGEVVSASSTGVQVTVEGGNHAALHAMLGQSQNETFTLGSKSEILIWTNGVPRVGTYGDLKTGDWVQLNVRAKDAKSLADVLATPVGTLGDHGTKPNPPASPLYLYVGTVAGPQAGGHIALHVTAGNAHALRSLVGQSADQTFTYGDSTIFLLWQGKVPTVIDASQLKAGDRITIRIRASKDASLSTIESTPAVHVGDHEPANSAGTTTENRVHLLQTKVKKLRHELKHIARVVKHARRHAR
jgi:hypothetical protein